ncbi:hypothetical protein TorRG33x02_274860 [Trema orientale]|uniref:Uncharacterized protein n=1 Tax=Trema orientale TaxID=63057 RepID=A0A2P5CSE0_TREOI|nr:hypothetical protein TorRG33x02_274860 [Trema orientale]
MAAADHEGELIGFEEGMSFLPSQVLDEACDTKAHVRPFQQHRHRHHHHHRRLIRFPAEELPMNTKSSNTRPPHRPKFGQIWASGGHGMQAIFLDSGQKSCGTGVFLPQRAGTNVQHSNNKKPACAPVLLPSRVVQALNLNVHALGLQISPRQDIPKANRKGGDINNVNNSVKNIRKAKDVASSQCCLISQKRNSSPELFLPKEWTY